MRIAICDDEKEIRGYLEELILTVDNSLTVIQYEDADRLLEDKFNADILLLDIQMPGVDGMEAARALRKRGSKVTIVFVTAIEEYVFDAFDVGAVGYIVKPFDDSKVRGVLHNAINAANEQRRIDGLLSDKAKNNRRTILVKTDSGNVNISLSDVAYAEVFDRKIVLHMRNRSTISYYGRMSSLESIAGSDFFRIHRSYLINLYFVKSYDAKNVVVLSDCIPIARGKYHDFVKVYLEFYTRREGL